LPLLWNVLPSRFGTRPVDAIGASGEADRTGVAKAVGVVGIAGFSGGLFMRATTIVTIPPKIAAAKVNHAAKFPEPPLLFCGGADEPTPSSLTSDV